MDYINYEKRIFSYIIDFVIAFLVALLLSVKVGISFDFALVTFVDSVQILTMICYFGISLIFLLFFNGRTIGRMIMRIKIVDFNDGKLTFAQIFIRSLLESFIIMGAINVVYQLLYHGQHSFFDKACNTKIKY